jgi:hypothetical protein
MNLRERAIAAYEAREGLIDRATKRLRELGLIEAGDEVTIPVGRAPGRYRFLEVAGLTLAVSETDSRGDRIMHFHPYLTCSRCKRSFPSIPVLNLVELGRALIQDEMCGICRGR